MKKGVPVRIEVGPRDMEKDAVFYARRDKAVKDKVSQDTKTFVSEISTLLKTSKANYTRSPKTFKRAILKSSIAKKTLRLISAKKMQAMPQSASVSIAN